MCPSGTVKVLRSGSDSILGLRCPAATVKAPIITSLARGLVLHSYANLRTLNLNPETETPDLDTSWKLRLCEHGQTRVDV